MINDERPNRLPDSLPADPMHWADAWLKEAISTRVRRNPDAMTVVSVSSDGQPSARLVLCRKFVPDPGYLVFHTNYQSKKCLDFENNPRAAAVFHWDTLGRQIRIEGLIVKSPREESDSYFANRDKGSQLGAWGSDQSYPIQSKDKLIRQIRDRGISMGLSLREGTTQFTEAPASTIKRPPHWGGLRLWANAIELWIEGRDRIHDRGRWSRNIMPASETEFTVTPWSGTRLQP
ncbi:MAG: pyridoxamine 5'-phosphate oxidase [Woeseia sp.]|nr:pyridoxamine 5'-phosphate oxidase [Woeseia sp.]